MAPIPTINKDDPTFDEDINGVDFPVSEFTVFDESDMEANDSDASDNENDEFNGYTLLPQESAMDENNDNPTNLLDQAIENTLESDDFINSSGTNMFNLTEPIDATSEGLNELWCSSRPQNSGDVMATDVIETIKSVMSKISLPQSAIPEWAKNINEDEWQDHLQQTRNKSKSMKAV